MKAIIKFGLFTLALASFFAACDVIENPIKEGGIPPPIDSTVVVRKVVIEDFTGHRCKNCPDAAKKIKELQAAYGDDVIGVAIHAKPSNFTGTTAEYPTDFRTPEGIQIFNFFNVAALPTGMVSRTDWTPTGNSHLKSYQNWPSKTATLLDSVAKFKMKIESSYNATDSSANISVEVEALANYNDDIKVVVMILESQIISPQLMPDNTKNESYEHNHVLRTTFTQALGDELKLSPIIIGEKYTKQVSGTIKSVWDADHCEIVAFIFNTRTNEILQAEEISLK